MDNRTRAGLGGLGVDIMTGTAIALSHHVALYLLFCIGAVLAAWGLWPHRPDISARTKMISAIWIAVGIVLITGGGFSLWYGLKIGGFLAVPAEAQTTATPAPDKGASPSVTITNPQGSNIVVGPTGGPVTQTIINPDLQKAPQRMLTEKQKAAISNALAEAPPATLFVPYNNSKEALNYSSQFRQIFHARGWIFSDFSGSDLRPKPFDKIRIGWREKKSSSYLAVIKGLTDAQIEFAEGEFTLNDLGTNRALDPSKDIVAFDVGVIPMTDLQIAIDRDQ